VSWTYRVVKRTCQCSNDKHEEYGIHEYYDASSVMKASITEDPVEVVADDLTSLKWTLKRMLAALDKPVLNHEDF
jgi:hypothetical protein